jgi:2-oxoglutarate ferredoxin oxidoreductase subunit beta
MKAKKYLRKAFEVQVQDRGFGFVEFLSACPTNWKMTPQKANERVSTEMIDYYPLGIFKEEQA